MHRVSPRKDSKVNGNPEVKEVPAIIVYFVLNKQVPWHSLTVPISRTAGANSQNRICGHVADTHVQGRLDQITPLVLDHLKLPLLARGAGLLPDVLERCHGHPDRMPPAYRVPRDRKVTDKLVVAPALDGVQGRLVDQPDRLVDGWPGGGGMVAPQVLQVTPVAVRGVHHV